MDISVIVPVLNEQESIGRWVSGTLHGECTKR